MTTNNPMKLMKMKMTTQARGLAALVPAALLAFTTSCSTGPKGEGAGFTAIQPGVPGGVRIETYQETATITGIDKPNRKVTMVHPDGTMVTLKAGPEVANFGQLEIGDQVKATVTEQLVVFARPPGDTASNAAATEVALAPLGAKPGAMMVQTAEVTAKVKSIDAKHQKATLIFPDGRTKTFKIRPDVDLTKQAVGTDVVIRATEAMALRVEKP